jgi:hypothetical protein
VLIQFVVCSDTIRFDQPDSVYINNALDSIIQNGQMLNIEYALQSYGKGFKNIIYKRRYVDKIIDTIVVAPEKNILPKFLNRIVYRLPKSAINHNLIEEIEKKKSLIMNKYYFISRKPDINIGRYLDNRLGMVIDLEPEFNSHFSGLFGATRSTNNKWNLNGELDIRLENIWNTMESFSFFWKKLDSTSQSINLGLNSPHIFDNGLGISTSYNYELVNGLYTETQTRISFEITNMSFGSFFLGYNAGRINTTSLGKNYNYEKSSFKGLLITFNHQSLNRRLLPDKGTAFNVETHLGKDTYQNQLYMKNSMTLSHILPLNNKINFCFKSLNEEIRALNGVINPARGIRYGGINSLRGYTDNQFRSNAVSIQTIELHFQKNPFLRTLLFFDFGMALDNTPKTGIGIGVFKLTDRALVELQYAIPEKTSYSDGKLHIKWTSRL